jgi:hypothetical protein
MDLENYKKPDLKAPRFRPDCLNILTPKDLAEFKKKFPQYKKIPDTKLKSIIKTLNINTWKQTIENRDGVELQEGLGYLFIGSCAHPTGRNINVPLSLEHGKKLKNMNLGSDSYLAKIFYSSFASKYKYEFRKLWKFKGCREFTRAVNKAYKENYKMYVQVDKNFKVSELYKKTIIRNAMKKLSEKKLVDYNEFNLD